MPVPITANVMVTTIGILICIWKKCRYGSSLMWSCFSMYPVPRWLCGTPRIDVFVEVVSLQTSKIIWAFVTSGAIYITRLRLKGCLNISDIQIIATCRCSRYLLVDWTPVLTYNRKQIVRLPSKEKYWYGQIMTSSTLISEKNTKYESHLGSLIMLWSLTKHKWSYQFLTNDFVCPCT